MIDLARNVLAALGVMPLYALFRFFRSLLHGCDVTCYHARMPNGAYRGKVVWITGASSGLGAEFARQLGALGAKVVLSARTQSALEEVRASILAAGAAPSDVVVFPLDMSDLAALAGAAAKVAGLFGRVDVLINNAGFSQRELGVHTEFDVTAHLTSVDYFACVALTKALLDPMKAQGGGTILNISSLAGLFGIPLRTSYCGAKAALLGYMDALRLEEHARGSGILVTNACPGSVRTNLARNAVLRSVGALRGDTDTNIEAGLEPSWVCERILAAGACGLDEVWLAKPFEMAVTYIMRFAPAIGRAIGPRVAAKHMKKTLAAVDSKDKSS